MSVLNNSNAIESGGYNIDRSLRFRSSVSAYLSRTPASAGNRKTWTWSGWVKRGAIDTNRRFLFSAGTGSTDATLLTVEFYTDYSIRVASGATQFLTTAPLYRDPSAWYHIVVVVDTSSSTSTDRVIVYVNGVRAATSAYTAPTQNFDLAVNSAVSHYIGCYYSGPSLLFDGYLAEVNFIDGQALTPSSFGQTDPVTGVWTPKKYTGTYGTNGFYLDFKDNTSATTLAYDKSGNGNNWTPNNISTTAGATYDSMTDVPTQSIGQGNGSSNYPTLNPIAKWGTSPANYGTASNGNLTHTESGSGTGQFFTTFPIPSGIGKWYWEITCDALMPTYAYYPICSLYPVGYEFASAIGIGGYASPGVGIYSSGNYYANNGAIASTTTAVSAGQTRCFAYDATTGKLWHRVNNGSWIGGGDPAAGTTPFVTLDYAQSYYPCVSNYQSTSTSNFGQRPFSYTPPTGFKALNTFNLPDPTIKKPNQYMDAYLNTGNGTTRTDVIAFQPDLVWTKTRNTATNGFNIVQDSVRGADNRLITDGTYAEGYDATYGSFTSTGFQFGSNSNVNTNGNTYVDWFWKKGATPGFDIVTYTGTGNAATTVPHSLGVTPAMIITKRRNSTGEWMVKHKSLATNLNLILNQTSATYNTTVGSSGGLADLTSSTTFGFVQGSSNTDNSNANGGTYVAYLFAEIAGFSKAFSYSGNGSSDGPFVFTNFQPKYVLIKRTDSTGNWYVWDTTRNTYNVVTNELYPNLSNAEASNSDLDANSNGFKIRNTTAGFNASGGSYIGMAFASYPFKYSTAR